MNPSLILAIALATAPVTIEDKATGIAFKVDVKDSTWCALFPPSLSSKTDCEGFNLKGAEAFGATSDKDIQTILVGAGDMQPEGELVLKASLMNVEAAKDFDVADYVRGVREEAAKAVPLQPDFELAPATVAGAQGCAFTVKHRGESNQDGLEFLIPVSEDKILNVAFRGPAATLKMLLAQRATLISELKRKSGRYPRLIHCAVEKAVPKPAKAQK